LENQAYRPRLLKSGCGQARQQLLDRGIPKNVVYKFYLKDSESCNKFVCCEPKDTQSEPANNEPVVNNSETGVNNTETLASSQSDNIDQPLRGDMQPIVTLSRCDAQLSVENEELMDACVTDMSAVDISSSPRQAEVVTPEPVYSNDVIALMIEQLPIKQLRQCLENMSPVKRKDVGVNLSPLGFGGYYLNEDLTPRKEDSQEITTRETGELTVDSVTSNLFSELPEELEHPVESVNQTTSLALNVLSSDVEDDVNVYYVVSNDQAANVLDPELPETVLTRTSGTPPNSLMNVPAPELYDPEVLKAVEQGEPRYELLQSCVVPCTPNVRKQIRIHFVQVPNMQKVVDENNIAYFRVAAKQKLTGAFALIDVPVAIGVINNFWDQVPSFEIYKDHMGALPVEMNASMGGTTILFDYVTYYHKVQ
jgi:hypothetical protein